MHWWLAGATACWASTACLPCHAARVKVQAQTPHAQAMKVYDGDHFAGRAVTDRAGVRYSFDASGLRVEQAEQAIAAPVRWAFGSGEQAVTLLLEWKSRWIEHRLSWYRDGNRLGLTPGHDPAPGLDLADSLGVVQTERNAKRCFGCHQTGAEPGVHCQACHGEGGAHRMAPAKGNIRRDRSVALCATCHRSPDETFASSTPELEDPRSIRFAPIGLQVSKCFLKSKSQSLTCVTCHDPHGEPRAVSTNAVCRGCHAAEAAVRKSCPRTGDACVTCHMQSSSPIAGLKFTDHRIRVFRGE